MIDNSYASFIAFGVILGIGLLFSIFMFILAIDSHKRLRKYRYRYGYDDEIENPTKANSQHDNESFKDWVNRVGFKKT